MKKNVYILITSLCLTIICALNLFQGTDFSIQDKLYQKRSVTSPDIVIVGIDDKALAEIGPYQDWNRDMVAAAVDYLNESDDIHPSAICLDIVYAGERDAECDSYLVNSCSKFNNVVAGSVATFGSDLVEAENGVYSLDSDAVISYEEPFDELKEVVTVGNINAMLDKDGILRHHMLKLDVDGQEIDSMVLAAAKKHLGLESDAKLELPKQDKKHFWYVPFSGLPGDYYESISIADLLYGNIEANYFDDKVVFIGVYATGLQDSYITAIDHSVPMYGVEFQANALQAILDGNYKQEINEFLQAIILFILLSFALYIFLNSRFSISTVAWILLEVAFIFSGIGLYNIGYIIHIIYAPACLFILYVTCMAANYIKSVLEKRAVTTTFKRYVAPEIVNEILKEGTQNLGLGGKTVNIAVLFVDVRGFTTMSESMEPEQVVAILNEYLTLIADCVMKNGGTLDKFVGDAAMAIWGAPTYQEDYVMKALMAASDMVKGADTLSRTLMEKYGHSVSFGIGVHVGDAVVGNMGSPNRMDYTAIGDTVNTAARLEANAPGGQIYISAAVMDMVGDRIEATSLGNSVKLKGKREDFEVLVLDKIL